MASSFVEQIPVIVDLIAKINPRKVLDIGKGFGKYGFLIHEYVGVDNTKKIDSSKTLAEQSQIQVDAVEVDADLLLPHLSQLYNQVITGDIRSLYPSLTGYDLVLMIDIIEHIEKEVAIKIISHFVDSGTTVLIATPKRFFNQHLNESIYEEHISHWTVEDFREKYKLTYQNCGSGRIYVLSATKQDFRGFGNHPLTRLRRLARLFREEFYN